MKNFSENQWEWQFWGRNWPEKKAPGGRFEKVRFGNIHQEVGHAPEPSIEGGGICSDVT
jgi:hypothetical protein